MDFNDTVKINHAHIYKSLDQATLQPFTAPLECRIANDGKSVELLRGFYYYRAGEPSDKEQEQYYKQKGIIPYREEVKVPFGFKSDGFTNMGLHQIIPKYGKGLKCAILHDFLCEKAHKGLLARKEADDIFLEAMLETKSFTKFKAYMIYYAVRAYAKIKGLDTPAIF